MRFPAPIIIGLVVLFLSVESASLGWGQSDSAQPAMAATTEAAPSTPALSAVAPASDGLVSLDFQDADIKNVLKVLAYKSGTNIVAGPEVTGIVTIQLTDVPWQKALETVLSTYGYVYERKDNIIIVSTIGNLKKRHDERQLLSDQEPLGSIVVSLQSVRATDVVALLEKVKSNTGKVIADEQSNSVIIEEVPERLKQLLDYIKTIDVQTEMKVYKLQYVPVETIAIELQKMASPKIGSVKFNVLSNKLFMKDTTVKLREMEKFIQQIDVPLETKVFKISYAKAEDLAKAITPMLTKDIIGGGMQFLTENKNAGSTPSSSENKGTSSMQLSTANKDIGSIQFDVRYNTLVVTDTPAKIREIATVIAALDKKDKEVLIEAKIVQIELSDSYQMGINWERIIAHLSHKMVDLKNDFSLLSTVSPVSVATIGTLTKDNYNVVLQMIATLGNTRLLSNPHIAVINHQEAQILVGTTTPYITS